MELHELKKNPGATHERRRVGRGMGSGLGKTSGYRDPLKRGWNEDSSASPRSR